MLTCKNRWKKKLYLPTLSKDQNDFIITVRNQKMDIYLKAHSYEVIQRIIWEEKKKKKRFDSVIDYV
jgi:hypothetical protein